MGHHRIDNYLRTYRKRIGLTQDIVVAALGLKDKTQLSRYERLEALPPLLTALAFEDIFHVPVSELFAGIHENVCESVEENLQRLGQELQQKRGNGPEAAATARALEWLHERQHAEHFS